MQEGGKTFSVISKSVFDFQEISMYSSTEYVDTRFQNF